MSELESRKRDVMAARLALLDKVETIKQRVAPASMAESLRGATRNTARNVAQTSADAVRRRPIATASACLAAVLWILRKPIVKAWHSARQKERQDA